MDTTKCLGQDYIESLDELERTQLERALAWQRGRAGRVILYLEAGERITNAIHERYHVVDAKGSRGQYVQLEPRA